MPLITIDDWNGIPGIIVAAPAFQCFDVAYSEQLILERQGLMMEREKESVTMPWSYDMARRHWEIYKPWWARY